MSRVSSVALPPAPTFAVATLAARVDEHLTKMGAMSSRGERGGAAMKKFSPTNPLRASAPPRETLHREAVWK